MSQDRKYKTKNSQYRPGMATAGQRVNPSLDAERRKRMGTQRPMFKDIYKGKYEGSDVRSIVRALKNKGIGKLRAQRIKKEILK